jgi:hypothetical protein
MNKGNIYYISYGAKTEHKIGWILHQTLNAIRLLIKAGNKKDMARPEVALLLALATRY